MTDNKKHIALLGSTGSIGTQALDVIEANANLFVVEVLSANSNSDLLIKQALKFNPNAVVIVDETKYQEVFDALSNQDIKVYAGKKALAQVVEMEGLQVKLEGNIQNQFDQWQTILADIYESESSQTNEFEIL